MARASGLQRALVDCRNYLGGAGFRDVLSLTREVTDRPVSERGREPFFMPADPYAAADVTFYVHTANGLGTIARMFASREAAVGWLMGWEPEGPTETPQSTREKRTG